MEQDFAYFGFPHSLVTVNAATFTSQEFQAWPVQGQGDHSPHTSALPSSNQWGSRVPCPDIQETIEEDKVTTKRSSLKVSDAMPKDPLLSGYSPSKLLNGRHIRTKLKAMVQSLAHVVQCNQARGTMKFQQYEQKVVSRYVHQYKVGTPCYTLFHGSQRDKDPRWVHANVTKVHGSRSVYVGVYPRGPVWRRDIEQLRPRYEVGEDIHPSRLESQ